MSDCQRCAALSLIAHDATLTTADMVQLARDAMNSQSPCSMSGLYTIQDYRKIASMPVKTPNYDPDDPDNPMLDILLPNMAKSKHE